MGAVGAFSIDQVPPQFRAVFDVQTTYFREYS